MHKKKVIALVVARGRSKGIKNKNLLEINKKTLVQLALENAISSKLINEIYLSSDSKNILDQAKKFPRVKIHIRNKKAATDKSGSKEVIEDFFKKNQSLKSQNSLLVYIQPSSPFLNYKHIDKSIKIFQKLKKDTLITCYKPDYDLNEKIFKSFVVSKEKNLSPLFKKNTIVTPRQTLGQILLPNGAFFIFKIKKNFLKDYINLKKSYGYIMNKNEVVDINIYEDYLKAKKFLSLG